MIEAVVAALAGLGILLLCLGILLLCLAVRATILLVVLVLLTVLFISGLIAVRVWQELDRRARGPENRRESR